MPYVSIHFHIKHFNLPECNCFNFTENQSRIKLQLRYKHRNETRENKMVQNQDLVHYYWSTFSYAVHITQRHPNNRQLKILIWLVVCIKFKVTHTKIKYQTSRLVFVRNRTNYQCSQKWPFKRHSQIISKLSLFFFTSMALPQHLFLFFVTFILHQSVAIDDNALAATI